MAESKRPALVEMLDDAGRTIGWAIEWEDWLVTARAEPEKLFCTYPDLTALRAAYPDAHLRITG